MVWFVFHEENDRKNKEIILKQVFKYTPTVSAILQPQGFIFQVDFLSKKWGFIQEKPQKVDFSHYLGLYSREGQH